MVVLGIVLLVIGLIAHVGILFWLGVVLAVVGAIFLAGSFRPTYTGRRYY